MKRLILGAALLALSTASFVIALNAEPRELAYGLLSLAYLLFVLAVVSLTSRLVASSRMTRTSGGKQDLDLLHDRGL